MKLVILSVLAVVALVASAPQRLDKDAQIIVNDKDQQPDGPYTFRAESDNQIKQEEEAQLKQVPDAENKPVAVLAVRGSYSYVDPDGNPHSVTYTADETGFHVESADVPRLA